MSSELRVDKIVPVDGVPTGGGGGIVQVLQIEHATSVQYTSGSYTSGVLNNQGNATGNYSITITPKFNTSKILVSFNCHYDLNIANQRAYITIYRSIGGGTPADIAPGRGLVEIWNPDSRTQASCMAQYLDSPSTTSAVTYTVYARTDTQGGDFYLGLYNNKKWMHAMEVSA